MKKYQKTDKTKALRPQILSQEKPKLDLITLLPQILKILPKLNLENIFGQNNKAKQVQPRPESRNLMQDENTRAVIQSMQIHSQMVEQIKSKNNTTHKSNF